MKAKSPLDDRLLPPEEAAGALGISERALRRMQDEGEISYIQMPGVRLTRTSEVVRVIDAHEVKAKVARTTRRKGTRRVGGRAA